MAFANSLECHFSKINQTPSKTEITVRIYKVSDGGLDVQGNQIYNRILVITKDLTLDAGELRSVIVQKLLNRVSDINSQLSLGYSLDKFICSI